MTEYTYPFSGIAAVLVHPRASVPPENHQIGYTRADLNGPCYPSLSERIADAKRRGVVEPEHRGLLAALKPTADMGDDHAWLCLIELAWDVPKIDAPFLYFRHPQPCWGQYTVPDAAIEATMRQFGAVKQGRGLALRWVFDLRRLPVYGGGC